MSVRLAYIHTVVCLVSTFNKLSKEIIPDVDVYHVVDEGILQNTIRTNRLSKTTIRNVAHYLNAAEDNGADLVMVTCSTLGPAVEIGRSLVNIPVLRIDEPMADLAVRTGQKIGVAATLQTTLDPTVSLIRTQAQKNNYQVEVVAKLCEGAFEAVVSGDPATHDRIVSEGLRELIDRVDVIVLAQASMARVVEMLPESDKRIPILSSPRLAVENLAEFIAKL